jgi:hypothetical protein
MNSGSNEMDPKLHWAIDYWRSITMSNTSEDEINNQNNLHDLNI